MNLLPRNSQALQGSDPLPQIETFVTLCGMVWLRGERAKVLGRLGWRLQAPFKSVCSILPIARHLRAGASYGVPALSFGLEALKRVGHAPSTFGSRPSGGHISNVGGCTSTLLARIRSRAPLCEEITHLRYMLRPSWVVQWTHR